MHVQQQHVRYVCQSTRGERRKVIHCDETRTLVPLRRILHFVQNIFAYFSAVFDYFSYFSFYTCFFWNLYILREQPILRHTHTHTHTKIYKRDVASATAFLSVFSHSLSFPVHYYSTARTSISILSIAFISLVSSSCSTTRSASIDVFFS